MKRLFLALALLGVIALLPACNKSDEPAIPEKLDGTRWITSETTDSGSAVVMLEFLDATNARYTKKYQGGSSNTPGEITPIDSQPSNIIYNYTYTYTSPNVVLKPMLATAPALSGSILGGQGGSYRYITLTTASGEVFFTAFQDDGSYIWQ